MKQFNLIILFFALFVFACSDNSIENEDNSPQNSEITSRNSEDNLIELEVDGNEYITKFHKLFGSDFKINRMYKYSDDIEMQYIYAEGFNSTNNFIISRYSITKALGEKCTGVKCSTCIFLNTGGCSCDKSDNSYEASCNHSITKEQIKHIGMTR